MPIPSFVPIIGSSFDALSNQQAGWAGFSANVENENARRAAAAQQNLNNYFANLSASRQAAADRSVSLQLQQDAADRELAWRQAQERTRQAERGQDIGLNRQMWQERLAEERMRTEAGTKKAELTFAAQQKAQDEAIDQHGQAAASNYLLAKRRSEQAASALSTLDDKLDTLTQRKAGEKDPMKQTQLGSEIKALQAQRNALSVAANRAENQFQTLHQTILNRGFDIDEDNGQILHPATGKRWSFKGAMNSPSSPDSSSGSVLSPLFTGLRATADILSTAPAVYAGFRGQQDQTAAIPNPSGTNTFKVGRFVVTPM